MESKGSSGTKRPEQTIEPAPGSQTGPRTGDSCCEPGCSCGTSSAGKGVRIVISLIALLLVSGIVLYKVSAAKTAVAVNPGIASVPASSMIATASNASPAANEPSPARPSSRTPLASSGRIGESLDSLKDLDTTAPIRDVIFVYIPGRRNETISNQTIDAVLSAKRVLEKNRLTLGLYTLRFESLDYPGLSQVTTTPAVLVRTKGRKSAFVSEGITEPKLLQAFTALSRGEGCCPSAK